MNLLRLLLVCGCATIVGCVGVLPGRNEPEIAFARNGYMMKMRADGSAVQNLAAGSGDLPSDWSSDRSQILFTHNNAITVCDADGSHPVQLTSGADFTPTWSPDGTKILFSRRLGADATTEEIFVAGADGSNPVRLTNNAVVDWSPRWSPDGLHIAFTSLRNNSVQIYEMQADGTGEHQLTTTGNENYAPAYSPNGSHIAYFTKVAGRYQVAIMASDGTAQTVIAQAAADNEAPTFSPDGTKLAYQSSIDGRTWDIITCNFDGSGSHNLTHGTGSSTTPIWRRADPGTEWPKLSIQKMVKSWRAA